MTKLSSLSVNLLIVLSILSGCNNINKKATADTVAGTATTDSLDFFLLRPKVEKDFGYSHAVRIGDDIKISGAVSMDDEGNPMAPGDLEQQMKNCYSDLDKILKHYGCSFDDVTVENIFATNMAGLEKVSGYRKSIYKKNFPTGTWVEVKGLASPAFMIEIEMEAHRPR